ncbi:MAG: hypothetical protein AB7V20_14160 [Phycisphaerales bacterium]
MDERRARITAGQHADRVLASFTRDLRAYAGSDRSSLPPSLNSAVDSPGQRIVAVRGMLVARP